MSTNTNNYKLIKPAQEDFYNVDDFNNNADIIDSQLKAVSDKAEAALPSSSYTAADILNKLKTVDGNGSGLDTDLFKGKSTIPVANGGTGATTAGAALTNLGAFPNSGGTLSGDLYANGGYVQLRGSVYSGSLIAYGNPDDNQNSTAIIAVPPNASEGYNMSWGAVLTRTVSGNENRYAIFSTYNKPTGNYTGNGSSEQRTIEIGGMALLGVLMVYSADYWGIINYAGAYIIPQSGGVVRVTSSEAQFQNGVLTLATNNVYLNEEGRGIYYQVI